MVRATSASYPGGATGSWTNSPYSRRRVTAAMDGSELLVAMTGSRSKWVMAGSWLSVRTQMGSGSGTAVVQRTAPTSTSSGGTRGPDHPTVDIYRSNLGRVLQALQEETSGEDPGRGV
jgi:hypothetical protein